MKVVGLFCIIQLLLLLLCVSAYNIPSFSDGIASTLSKHNQILLQSDDTTSGGAPVVQTAQGKIQGVGKIVTNEFLGIPYAQAPVGELRWKAPQPHPAWSNVLDASKTRSECTQPALLGPQGTEDCLFLNVYVPTIAPPPSGKYNVMVWIHGGGFGEGAGSNADGTALPVIGNVILVTINYRLGPFGFLYHPGLTGEIGAGNYGFLDQQLALQWVQQNIAAFGGDPKNVTIFGQSAGGSSMCYHLIAPGSKGLFGRVIIESGACAVNNFPNTATPFGEELAHKLNCKQSNPQEQITCLRKQGGWQVLYAVNGGNPFQTGRWFTWWPVNDGAVIPAAKILDVLKSKQFNTDVEVLIGSNLNEGTAFVYPDYVLPMSGQQYTQLLTVQFGKNLTQKVEILYPFAHYKNGQGALSDVIGDYLFACPAIAVERALVAAGITPYAYVFTHVPSWISAFGATHGAEVPFVFSMLEDKSLTSAEKELISHMKKFWSSFAKNGNPNFDATVEKWPAFDSQNQWHMLLDPPYSVTNTYKARECSFWQTLY